MIPLRGQNLPDYFENLFQVARTNPDLIPVITTMARPPLAKVPWPAPWPPGWATNFDFAVPCHRLAAVTRGISTDDEAGLITGAQDRPRIAPALEAHHVWLDGCDVSDELRQK